MSDRSPDTLFTPGQARQTDLSRVEVELSELWLAAEGAGREEQVDVLRLRTLNLLVYAASPQALQELRGPLAEITAAHPGRVLLLCPDPAAPEGAIHAEASIYCYRSRNERQHVCAEEITLTARGEAVQELHTAVLSLLLPDLPVVLWWTDVPRFDEYGFQSLAATANRLMIDTATFQEPLRQLGDCLRFVREQRLPALRDLSWTRITVWRELAAQFYDDQTARGSLERLDHVRIDYGVEQAGEQPPALLQALLLLGWLGSRLGWSPARAARVAPGFDLIFMVAEREVRVDLRAAQGVPGTTLGVLHLSGGGASFRIGYAPGAAGMMVEVELPEREPVSSLTRMGGESAASLLREELAMPGHDTVFEEALLLVGRMLELLG